MLRDLAADDGTPLGPRAAACLMLLHAQPLSRIIRLTAGDITRDDRGAVLIHLGSPPAPVPEPFAAMLTEFAAGKPGDSWLFPGLFPGQPVHYRTMHQHLRVLGLPMQAARAATLRELAQQVPTAAPAAALGFHRTTIQRHRARADLA